VVLLIYLDNAAAELRARAAQEARPYCRKDLYDAIMVGAVERVRPKMMTVIAIMAGLLPIMWSTGTGSEVMQRIAVPMIGGTVSSTLLTLIVIPAIYGLVKGWRLPSEGSLPSSPALPMRAKRRDPGRSAADPGTGCALRIYKSMRATDRSSKRRS
jgi:Cu(I)/Ag(I) efflux system membrane protein CusA/SilA